MRRRPLIPGHRPPTDEERKEVIRLVEERLEIHEDNATEVINTFKQIQADTGGQPFVWQCESKGNGRFTAAVEGVCLEGNFRMTPEGPVAFDRERMKQLARDQIQECDDVNPRNLSLAAELITVRVRIKQRLPVLHIYSDPLEFVMTCNHFGLRVHRSGTRHGWEDVDRWMYVPHVYKQARCIIDELLDCLPHELIGLIVDYIWLPLCPCKDDGFIDLLPADNCVVFCSHDDAANFKRQKTEKVEIR